MPENNLSPKKPCVPSGKLVRSCWIHTADTAYRRTLKSCSKCGGTHYDACGLDHGCYQCINCWQVFKISTLRPNAGRELRPERTKV
jgi:hypothetical protein